MWHRDDVMTRPAVAGDREWIRRTLVDRWGSTMVVSRGKPRDAAALPGIVAVHAIDDSESERMGLLTYQVDAQGLEVVTLDALRPRAGVGVALVDGAAQIARDAGASRLWLTTTNDNLRAVRFYQRRGLRIVAVHRGAVDRARLLKPSIPVAGDNGIELHDELELELLLARSDDDRLAAATVVARPVPTASVVVRDTGGSLLLVRRADDGTWCLPGGRLEPGESWAACAVRECKEETGLTVSLSGLFGVYSEPTDQVHTYPDGDRIQVTAVVFSAKVLAPEPVTVDPLEITETGYFPPDGMPAEIMRCDAPIVADVLSGDPPPFIR